MRFSKTLLAFSAALLLLSGCSSPKNEGWSRIPDAEIDQKSYAIAYGATGQTYADRVNESYDIDAFMKGVDHWFNKKVTLPLEQIRASLLNRMMDHNVYAYYSGVLYAAELQQKFHHLSVKCWDFVQTPSMAQGIHDAMRDIQANKVRHDKFIEQGVDQILHLCVEQVEAESTQKSPAVKKHQHKK